MHENLALSVANLVTSLLLLVEKCETKVHKKLLLCTITKLVTSFLIGLDIENNKKM